MTGAICLPVEGNQRMQYAHLGRSGVVVSRLCLGTMNFGWKTPEDESRLILNRALDVGMNFFDTANAYGHKLGEGITESLLGRWFAEDRRRRAQIVLATKVYVPMGHGVNERGLSAYNIRQCCEASLRRLQAEHIDVYYMHHIDRGQYTAMDKQVWGVRDFDLYRPAHLKRETPWDEIWEAMEVLVRQGKVLYVASSNFAAWNIAQACEKASQRHSLGLIAEQSLYHLNQRTVELEVIPACREYGVGLVPWSPLGMGLLAGTAQKTENSRRALAGDQFEKLRPKLDAYEAFCRELGERPADVALAWLLANPVVTSPIIGPRTIEQLTGSLHSLEVKLEANAMARLDQIFPGPGGEAPEAYAW
jgi:aryl-alcohol dehydrogenase-like predicted oxidoreductase